MQYTRNEMDFKRGTFRAKGDTIEIYPSDENEKAIRVEMWGNNRNMRQNTQHCSLERTL